MEYTIEIHYSTGDSFNSYDCVDQIAVTWKSYELAKGALRRLGEHYEWYIMDGKTWIFDEIKIPKFSHDRHGFNVVLDNGEEFWIGAFWCGVFESLRSARVVELTDKDAVYTPSMY